MCETKFLPSITAFSCSSLYDCLLTLAPSGVVCACWRCCVLHQTCALGAVTGRPCGGGAFYSNGMQGLATLPVVHIVSMFLYTCCMYECYSPLNRLFVCRGGWGGLGEAVCVCVLTLLLDFFFPPIHLKLSLPLILFWLLWLKIYKTSSWSPNLYNLMMRDVYQKWTFIKGI